MTAPVGASVSAWPSSRFKKAQADAHSRNSLQLLLIDDDDDYRESLKEELVDLGFLITDFRAPDELFAYFDGGGLADAVVLDLRLGAASGIDVLAKIRRQGMTMPVIILTGLPTTTFESAALDKGASDFVDKSRGVEILARRIRLITERRRAAAGEAGDDVRVGNLLLRPQVSRALWNDVDVNLTVTEFNIVTLLATKAGEYVTYRMIYDCVHCAGFVAGSGEDGYRTNVRSSVKRIRNKFRAIDAAFSEIENFPAFGYRWQITADRA